MFPHQILVKNRKKDKPSSKGKDAVRNPRPSQPLQQQPSGFPMASGTDPRLIAKLEGKEAEFEGRLERLQKQAKARAEVKRDPNHQHCSQIMSLHPCVHVLMPKQDIAVLQSGSTSSTSAKAFDAFILSPSERTSQKPATSVDDASGGNSIKSWVLVIGSLALVLLFVVTSGLDVAGDSPQRRPSQASPIRAQYI